MNAEARKALTTIRRCIDSDRVRLTWHFRVRLAERGVLWGDVLSVFDAPRSMRSDGFDRAGRARWLVSGDAADGAPIGMVCAIGRDARGALTAFVTVYWEDRP